MLALTSSIDSFTIGQRVLTGFGPGVISAIGYVDSIIYVTLDRESAGLYIFRPEQVEAIGEAA
jgi:hypothetical protein